jgi:pimeloyl-ACP methyl ester carboxylesterase
VIWGREDRWIPVEDAQRFATALPDVRAVVLERCGHVPQEECPTDVVRLMVDFLARPDFDAASPDVKPAQPVRHD